MDSPMITPFENDDPWQDRLSEYVDGLLSEPEASALEAHTQTCEHCRKAVAELRAVVERLRSDRIDEAPEESWPRIANRLGMQAVHNRGGWPTRYSGSIQTRSLRNITVAAALTITFVGGIWTGVTLSLMRSVWTPPGWMDIWPRKLHIPSLPGPLQPYGADSIPAEWIPLQRSLSDLDRQLASATAALRNAPRNEALRRVVQQLSRERDDLRALLDSVAGATRSRKLPQR
jgi:hypothetical protein